jgi:hypothetical protein
MAESSELEVGDLFGGSLKVTHCDGSRLEFKSPSGCFMGCGLAGILILLLAAVTWYGVISQVSEEGAESAFSAATKGALIYTVVGVLGVCFPALIESWVVDGNARTLTKSRALGLRRSTWNASDLVEVVFTVGEPDEEGNEPCKVLVRAKAEEPIATFGILAAKAEGTPKLLAGGQRIASMLGLPFRVDGDPQTASDALDEALRGLDS